MILKIIKENNIFLDLAIQWAISAKNALENMYGFSPNQLVFVKNISLPSIQLVDGYN